MTIGVYDRIRVRDLQLLHALGEARSLREAASAIAISQPAGSKLLRELERAIGRPLFLRTTQGITPTKFGVAMIRVARSVLAQMRSAEEELAGLESGRNSPIRVGLFAVAAAPIVASAVETRSQRSPAVAVRVEEGTGEGLRARLLQGELDCIVGRLIPIAGTALTSESAYCEEPIVLAVRDGHPLLRRKRLSLGDTVRHEWILPTREAVLRAPLEVAFAQLGLPLPKASIESSSFLVNETLLQTSDIICPFPRSLLPQLSGRLGIRLLPISPSLFVPRLGIWTRDPPPHSPALERMLHAIAEAAQKHFAYTLAVHPISALGPGEPSTGSHREEANVGVVRRKTRSGP